MGQKNELLQALGAGQPQGADDLHGAAWQAQQICLWLVANAAGLPDSALAGLGLDGAAIEKLQREHRDELTAWRQMQAAAALLTRTNLASLLRARVAGMALTARTPSELAAVARTVRTLPDWVWDDAVVEADRPRVTTPSRLTTSPDGGFVAGFEGAGADQALLDTVFGPQLNRAERRRLEAVQKKGK